MFKHNLTEYLIFGPSHAVRLRHLFLTGQLPELFLPSRIVGIGGMPIWSPRIRQEMASSNIAQNAFFIVGDFRFGNAVLKYPNFKPNFKQEKEYLAIDKELINEENDTVMFDLCRSEIESLNLEFKGRLRLLFWDISIREFQNRVTGRYQDSGIYRHPVWNLNDILEEFADIAIDTRDMLKYGERLYIDSSAHPSLMGWLYIAKYLRGDRQVDLLESIQTFDNLLKNLLDSVRVKGSVLITGDSKFTRILDLFVQKGHFQLPVDWVIRPLSKAVDAESFDHCLYFPALCTFQMNAAEISEEVEKIRKISAKLASKHKKMSIIYYDNWAYESISKRADYLNKYICKHISGLTSSLEFSTCPKDQSYKISDSLEFEGMIELNNTLIPTTLGFLEIICRSAADMTHEQVVEAYNGFVTECYG
jgi:hypothetical protein